VRADASDADKLEAINKMLAGLSISQVSVAAVAARGVRLAARG
jgi:hypothetical protein